jgi:hypothetical protein
MQLQQATMLGQLASKTHASSGEQVAFDFNELE